MKLVDMHSSWLVINSVVGCTNACKYCLLQDNGKNLCEPKILGTPREAIKELLSFKFYDKTLPVCLFPNTDIFLNSSNIDYLKKTLNEIEKHNIPNDLIIITKCYIPCEIIHRLRSLISKGRKIVIYLSYSGLGKDIEPNVDHQAIRENFRNLKEAKIPIIHYYRPFIPQNSDPKTIRETLNFVHQYTPISATMGLMYVPTMMEQNKTWDYLKSVNKETLKRAVSIWPEEAWNYFYNEYDSEQFFFQTNTCALNSILGKPSLQYYKTFECENYNHCSEEQKKLCKKCTNEIKEADIIKKLEELLNHLGVSEQYTYVFDNNHGLEIKGLSLDVKSLSYLSHLLGIKVYVRAGKALNDIYNSTLNGSKPYILRRKFNE